MNAKFTYYNHSINKYIFIIPKHVQDMCFTKFWLKLDKFIMVKVANPLINED
jgi:hypothetical protein